MGCICTPLVISDVTVQQLEFLELQFKIIYLYINKFYPGSLHFPQILFHNICFIENTAYFHIGTSLAFQWSGLIAFTAAAPGLIPGWGTKIPQATWHRKKEKCHLNLPLGV